MAQFDTGVNQTHTPVARQFLRNASFGLNSVQKGVFDYSEYQRNNSSNPGQPFMFQPTKLPSDEDMSVDD